jgi:hypothetical protein
MNALLNKYADFCRSTFAVRPLPFDLCRSTFAVRPLPFDLCRSTFAVRPLPFDLSFCHFFCYFLIGISTKILWADTFLRVNGSKMAQKWLKSRLILRGPLL